MTGYPILTRFQAFGSHFQAVFRPGDERWPDLHTLWLHPERLPRCAAETPLVERTLALLGPLDWGHFPERNLGRRWRRPAVSYAAFAAAMLLKLNEGLASMGEVRRYLVEHPALIPLLGFRVVRCRAHPHGIDPQASLPTSRHLTRMLRQMPNAVLQFLLADSVHLIRQELRQHHIEVGECISLDTRHILAWVKENNPNAYVEERFDKTRQPRGDPDCRLGCKRRHNQQSPPQPLGQEPPTPAAHPQPGEKVKFGEFYWGYGSGVVVTQTPGWGELVLAELTQPFDQADVSYFFPLMTQVEQRLGFRPRFAAFDAAFDAWYVYAYFHRDEDPLAFAAVPFSEKGGYKAKDRTFSPEGLPLCAAGLPMPLHFTYTDRTTCSVAHERGKYVCPLRFPQRTADACPVHHKCWEKQGCAVMMPTSIGARLRYTLDRESQLYKDIYKQRTATERINSQAKALGIERPLLRNGKAIANQNTLIYLLINLRLLQRIRNRQPESRGSRACV
ncbi:MAG: transposase [Anaerolineales bacterium]|nr:transposase [Anaerolineales bacterium]